MITWFDKNRTDMLHKVCDKVLSGELYGHMSVDDIMEALEVLESFKENVRGNPESDESDEWDLASEMSQAIVAETVQRLDAKLMDNFTLTYRLENHDLDMDCDVWDSDGFPILVDKILAISKMFDEGNTFIVCSPVTISMIQSTSSAPYQSKMWGKFKGPNNTMLWGTLDEVPVYSYIYAVDADITVIGNYNSKKDVCQTHTLTVKNFTF